MDTIAKLERLLTRGQDAEAAQKQAERNSVVDREEAARVMSEILKLITSKDLNVRTPSRRQWQPITMCCVVWMVSDNCKPKARPVYWARSRGV